MEILSYPTSVRRRPAMYVGDCGSRGLQHLVTEVLDNVADQFLAGQATRVDVEIEGGLIRVSDDGPGLPFDESFDAVCSQGTHFLTCMHHCPTADNHAPHVHFNGFGCGLAVVNALSDCLTVQSWRDGQLWEQCFSCGEPTEPVHVVDRGDGRGTTFEFSPDSTIFGETVLDEVALRERLKTISHLIPGFTLTLQGETFHAPNGLADWCRELAGQSSPPPLHVNQQAVFVCPPPAPDGSRQAGEYSVQAAATGTAQSDTVWKSFANGNETIEGGTHLTAFKRLLADKGWKPAVAMLHVVMNSPRFAGPTRAKLHVPGMDQPIRQAVESALQRYIAAHGPGGPSV